MDPGDEQTPTEFFVGQRVRIYPGGDEEQHGVIVEDFGPLTGTGVEIGDVHIAAPSRRWAIIADDGSLSFVDSRDISQ